MFVLYADMVMIYAFSLVGYLLVKAICDHHSRFRLHIIYSGKLAKSKYKLNRMKVALVIIPITYKSMAHNDMNEYGERRQQNKNDRRCREMQNRIIVIKSIHCASKLQRKRTKRKAFIIKF